MDAYLLKEIANRRSVRKFENRPIDADVLQKLIESARLAPSGSNTQPWTFIIVTEEEMKRKIVHADHDQIWMLQAPVFIVCVADIRTRIPEGDLYLDENSAEPELKRIIRDTAIAVEHMVLQAEHLGLATCHTGWFRQEEIRPLLGIPEDKYVCNVLVVGYAKEIPKQRPRRPLEELIKYERWD